jgi:mevalonate pyrophosphate decarboxylase
MTADGRVLIQPKIDPKLRDDFKDTAHRNGLTAHAATAQAYRLWIKSIENAKIDEALEIARRYEAGEIVKTP